MYSQGQRKHAGRTDGRGGRAVWCMFTLPMFALRLRGPGPHLAKQVQSISSLEPGIENTASWGATLIISYSRSQISFKWKRKEHNILKNRSNALTHTLLQTRQCLETVQQWSTGGLPNHQKMWFNFFFFFIRVSGHEGVKFSWRPLLFSACSVSYMTVHFLTRIPEVLMTNGYKINTSFFLLHDWCTKCPYDNKVDFWLCEKLIRKIKKRE